MAFSICNFSINYELILPVRLELTAYITLVLEGACLTNWANYSWEYCAVWYFVENFMLKKKQLSTFLKIVNRYKPLKRTHLLIIFRTTIVGIRQSYRYHCIPWANLFLKHYTCLLIYLFVCLFVKRWESLWKG